MRHQPTIRERARAAALVLCGLAAMACDAGDASDAAAPGSEGAGGAPSGGDDASAGHGASGGRGLSTGGTAGDGTAMPGGMAGPGEIDGVYAVGRFDWSHPDGPTFAWPGTRLSARFEGTSVSVELDDSGQNYFHVIIDGELQPDKLGPSSGRDTYLLAEGLADGEHEVTLHRITEASLGETQLIGFDFGDGQMRPYGAPLARRIEVIGDSITCGYGVEGADRNCPFSAETENQYLTYASIAARALDAELVAVAWSGKGVFSNRGSTVDTQVMPELWKRTLPEDPASEWDFSSWQPDVVVINLGTNDYAETNPDKSPFADAYLAFLREVRATYPDADLLATVGPLLSDYWPEGEQTLTTARNNIQGAIDTLASEGDSAVHFLEFPLETDADGWGCDWHPSIRKQEMMGERLENELRAIMGW